LGVAPSLTAQLDALGERLRAALDAVTDPAGLEEVRARFLDARAR